MVFSSMVFLWIFLPVVLVGNLILHRLGSCRLSSPFLLAASLFFYAWGEPLYVFLMLFTVYINWKFGILLDFFQKRKKIILLLALLFNLSILGWFKYSGMVTASICSILGIPNNMEPPPLPIGISFFTFQALSYVVDVYRGDCRVQRRFDRLLLYISFFPQLIAGPIVKYKDIEKQISEREISIRGMAEGIRRFSYGLGKKVLLSNVLAAAADSIYALEMSEITSPMIWVASLCYTFQIYYDFSGYSDMAIGLGRMLGFHFQENFQYPYTALSIREFWRRWHISLSSWFREYVYIPLGGNRKGHAVTYKNLMFVFFLTGLWHGASWNFVFWGLFHGFFLTMERGWLGKILERHKLAAWLYTFMVMHFGWIFFRVEYIKEGLSYIKRMMIPWLYTKSNYSVWEFVDNRVLLALLMAAAGFGVIQRVYAGRKRKDSRLFGYVEAVWCMGILFLSILSLTGSTYNPFIYFRF